MQTYPGFGPRLSRGPLVRNVAWNLSGLAVPLVVAVLAIPLLVRGLGIERFGILTLIWVVIGYSSLFDLGLGRAVTQVIPARLASGADHQATASIVWTSVLVMVLTGLIGAILIAPFAPWLVHSLLKVPTPLQTETLNATWILIASLPVVTSAAGLRGVLEAHHRFDLSNAVRLPWTVFNYVSPLLVLPFSKSLTVVVLVLLIGRLAGWLCYFALCLHVMPSLRNRRSLFVTDAWSLIRIGGWMTISNVVHALMVYVDRFLIGAVISVAAVAYYATPYEMVTRLWIIPSALSSVLFPVFAASVTDRARAVSLFRRSVNYSWIVLFPLVLVLVTFAYEALGIWLGKAFAQQSTLVLQLLALGVFINSPAQLAVALIQGLGRPDLTAKWHLIELPLYVILLLWLVHIGGINGAAFAWTTRVTLDVLILFAVVSRLASVGTATMLQILAPAGLSLLAFALVVAQTNVSAKLISIVGALAAFSILSWSRMLSRQERDLLTHRFRH